MKKIQPLLLLLLISYSSLCQDLSGIWEGEFSTDIKAYNRRTFFMHMEIQQTGRDVRAIFFNSLQQDIAHPGVMYRISGRFGKRGKDMFPLTLARDGIIKNNIAGVAEVFIGLNARYFQNDTMQILYGTWIPNQGSPRSDGAGGVFWVRKASDTISQYAISQLQKKIKKSIKKKLPVDTLPQIPADGAIVKNYSQRKELIADTILVPSENVRIELYDNAETDGDSVSIYVDDRPVLIQQLLSAKPIVTNVELTKGKQHKISLFADNMGTIPPNTALMVIIAGSLRKYVFLSADYNTNASVVLGLMD
jgi:hypothetical protein